MRRGLGEADRDGDSGGGGRRRLRRSCREREVEVAHRFPGGETKRERVKAPVSGKSAAFRWAQERETIILTQLAGHQDLTTTQRYIHLSPAHKDAAIRLLDRRPVEEAAPDSVVLSAPTRPRRTGEEQDAASPAVGVSVGASLETTLRPEPEPNCLE